MPDQNLNARLARMETSLAHIERDVQKAQENHAEYAKQTQDFVARLVRLEVGDKALADLPTRMSHAEATNDVQEAVKAERSQMIREIRTAIYGGIGAFGVIISIIWYFIGNGS